ncbi:MAG TPA: hypothetical protein VEL28_14770 [Candidatus Binatia bacterium]|nr:hypothetical protein [Candidatus Binatia bacterium]
MIRNRAMIAVAAALATITIFNTGGAEAADPKLDAANSQVSAAITSLETANLPDAKGQRCSKQAAKAIRQLRKAQATIATAASCQDGTAPAKETRKQKKATKKR